MTSNSFLISKSQSLSLSTNGAVSVTDIGSQFSVQLNQAIRVPGHAINPRIELLAASVWWTVPNVIANQNDTITITQANPPVGPTNIVLPTGLYTLNDINATIERLLRDAGFSTADGPSLVFTEDRATQKVILTRQYVGTTVDFSSARSIAPLLGYDSVILPITTVVGEEFIGENTAQISPLEYFLIGTDLTDSGSLIGNQQRGIIAKVPISVIANQQINYEPRHRVSYECERLKGRMVRSVEMYLYSEKLVPVRTGGEPWAVDLVITWQEVVRT